MSHYGSGKDTTIGYEGIDVRFLQEHGYLVAGNIVHAFLEAEWNEHRLDSRQDPK